MAKEVQELHGLKLGQEVTWEYHCRGGYGRVIFVKATVIKLNPKKCRIEADAQKRSGEVYRKQANADYSKIKESTEYKPINI